MTWCKTCAERLGSKGRPTTNLLAAACQALPNGPVLVGLSKFLVLLFRNWGNSLPRSSDNPG